jgi:hypothetical protein
VGFVIRPLAIASLIAALSFAGSVARAAPPDSAWTSRGLVVCGAPNTQGAPVIAPDGFGGFFLAWEDARADADTTDLFVQHLQGDGTVAPGWPAGGQALCVAQGNQNNPQLVSDGVGGVFAVWEDSRVTPDPRLYAQHLSANGALVPGWTADGESICGAAGTQRAPQMIGDGAGGVLVAWEDYRIAPPRVFVQHLNANGSFATGWTADGIAAAPVPGGQVGPVIASDGSGGAIVAWSDARGGAVTSADIYAQHLLSDGTLAAGWPSDGFAVCVAPEAQERPSITSDAGGGAFVTWMDPRDGLYHIYAQHLTGLGTAAAGWSTDGVMVCGAFPAQYDPVITTDDVGDAMVAWIDTRSINGSGDVYAQRLDADGLASWTPDGVALCTALRDQLFPSIVSDGSGGAFVAWQDGRYGAATRPFVQRVTATGQIANGWPVDGRAVADSNVVYGTPALAPDGNGGVVVAWSGLDLLGAPGPPDLYASRIAGNSVVPALASLVSADANPNAVRLSWALAGGGAVATLERASDPSRWDALATLIADGTGRVSYEDRDVTPGARVGYRLRLSEGVAGETWVTVPRAALAIRSIAPRPASDRAQVSLALAEPRPARLELFDLAGRRRWSRDLDGVSLEVRVTVDASALEPGLYVMRLSQGERAAAARFVVAR